MIYLHIFFVWLKIKHCILFGFTSVVLALGVCNLVWLSATTMTIEETGVGQCTTCVSKHTTERTNACVAPLTLPSIARCQCNCRCRRKPRRLVTCDWCGRRVGPGCCLFHEDHIRSYCHWCRPGRPTNVKQDIEKVVMVVPRDLTTYATIMS